MKRGAATLNQKESDMFLMGLCVGLFVGANIGMVIPGMLLRAKLEQRITRTQLEEINYKNSPGLTARCQPEPEQIC